MKEEKPSGCGTLLAILLVVGFICVFPLTSLVLIGILILIGIFSG